MSIKYLENLKKKKKKRKEIAKHTFCSAIYYMGSWVCTLITVGFCIHKSTEKATVFLDLVNPEILLPSLF